MGLFGDILDGAGKMLKNTSDEINKWYEKYQYKSDDELKRIASTGLASQKMAAMKVLRDRGYGR